MAQDAFLAAFEQIAEFRGEGTFQAWVKRIAARLYVKRWRREARAPELLAGDAGAGSAARAAEPPSADRIDLDEALQALSDAERVCVSLCYGGGTLPRRGGGGLECATWNGQIPCQTWFG